MLIPIQNQWLPLSPRVRNHLAASQDSHAPSSIVKDSIISGHHDDAPFVLKLANICFCLHHSWILLLSTPISLSAASLLFFSVHSTAFSLKETLYDFHLHITLTNLCSFATEKCDIDSRQVTNQLSTQTCRSRGVSITANSCSRLGYYLEPASIKDLSF